MDKINIEIQTKNNKDYLIVDGFLAKESESIKPRDILDMLEYLGYIIIKIEE